MKVLAVLSEQFYKNNNNLQTTLTSTKFIQNTFGYDNVVVVSPVTSEKSHGYSSIVNGANFEEVPYFSSIKSFVINSLFKKKFYTSYIKRCNELIDKYPEHVIWLRNPSIGSLVFGVCAIRKRRNIVNHMCANAVNGWKNTKYSFPEKILGFIFSKIIHLLIIYITKNKNTVNLCTGDELFNMCHPHNKKTYQFVDVMLEKNSRLGNENFKLTDERRDNFLYVGRVILDKGVEDLCLAFSCMGNEKYKLDIVGGGDALEYLKNRFSENKNIIFHGQIENEKLPRFFAHAVAIVVPSQNAYEGFPRVIMESWLYNTPVIAYDTGGVKAFLRDGVNGLLVKKNDIEGLKLAMIKITDRTLHDVLRNGSDKMSKSSSFSYWSSRAKSILEKEFKQ